MADELRPQSTREGWVDVQMPTGLWDQFLALGERFGMSLLDDEMNERVDLSDPVMRGAVVGYVLGFLRATAEGAAWAERIGGRRG